MKTLSRFVVTAGLLLAVSCNHADVGTLPAPGSPLTIADTLPRTVHVIPFYNYSKLGFNPGGPGSRGNLSGSATELYGATVVGGDASCSTPYDGGSVTGCGIVYRLVPNTGKPTYKIQVLHAFAGSPADGAADMSKLLVEKNGDIYGTTFYGGTYDEGTLFKLHANSSGYVETIIHNFGYGQDAAYPVAGVIEAGGILYGTTIGGGTHANALLCKHYGGSPNGTCGAVYSVNLTSGAEQVLHSFGAFGDGEVPWAGLLDVAGTLYGATYLGGSNAYCGTVFSLGTDGSNERILHSFLNASYNDGCDPFSDLIAVKGTLYGTTCCGGGNFCSYCHGVLYSVDISTGHEQVLHEFGKPKDGSQPLGAVVDVDGTLYGTTSIGGQGSCSSGEGCGTIFSFTLPSSTYNVTHRLDGRTEGAGPLAALLYSEHALYGTTTSGGKKGLGTGIKLVSQ